PPTSASQTYKSLHTTSLAFISAQSFNPTLPPRMNIPLLKSLCTSSFTHTFGHHHAVSAAPPLQGTFSFDAFAAHLGAMVPRMESWELRVADVLVDEVLMRCVVRVSYFMRVKGVDEGDVVENDVLWMLGFEKEAEGEGVKVCTSVEFVDGVAAGRLRELM
ncbi:hypothetical protein COCHEDRAFT_1069631, partial [Bipolaris maydis C5]